MGLLPAPALKKFFVNKIESSRLDWGDYLLKVADIFSTFDGDDLDREIRSERFSEISGRSIDAPRDISNFRDEFGAYGSFLGLFHIKLVGDKWKIFLSNATKHFLCSTEPDVESFCRTQLSLFQYPNGIGAVQNRNGSVRVQNNILTDTKREISSGLRVNPLRLLCRIAIAQHQINNVPLNNIYISYRHIFMLMNDDRINTTFSPDIKLLANVINEYSTLEPPSWVNSYITQFQRNFHILEWTGLFTRNNGGLSICSNNIEEAYSYILSISEMTNNFSDFERCYGGSNVDQEVRKVISSSAWGEYYDSLTLSTQVLASLSSNIDNTTFSLNHGLLGSIPPTIQEFPAMHSFQSDQPRAYLHSGNITDPFETLIRREKANCEHARILKMLASRLRLHYTDVLENTFIDLFLTTGGYKIIFEVKSNNDRNVLSQIRKAIAQLYEYRYRSNLSQAHLCIVLQQKPPQDWVIDYLLNDRRILICWLVDDVRLECPVECHNILAEIGVLE